MHPEIQDGPFADTKEKLGGIFVIDVPDLDEALDWAQRNPANGWGSVEIRPVARTYAAERRVVPTPERPRWPELAGHPQSYGRLLALLAAPGRDIAAAEDALADAVERALTRWPRTACPPTRRPGCSSSPATGSATRGSRPRTGPAFRSTKWTTKTVRISTTPTTDIPDRRLELMLVCAHPAIAASVRTPLMLQVVLGVDAAAIAAAFAVEPAAMAQRLVRAKKRIRRRRHPVRHARTRAARRATAAVLEAVYGAYAIDWQLDADGAPSRIPVGRARCTWRCVLAELLPDEPEVLGLAALVCLSEARRPARPAEDGRFVPLDEQDADRWDRVLIDRGEALLIARARGIGRPGRFQYEAAIQSVHASRQRAARGPSTRCGRCAPCIALWCGWRRRWGPRSPSPRSTARLDGPAAGLRALDALADPAVDRFQPALAVRAHLLDVAGRTEAAPTAIAARSR